MAEWKKIKTSWANVEDQVINVYTMEKGDKLLFSDMGETLSSLEIDYKGELPSLYNKKELVESINQFCENMGTELRKGSIVLILDADDSEVCTNYGVEMVAKTAAVISLHFKKIRAKEFNFEQQP
jgi:molybdopterin converting factor small subunit